MNKNLSAELNSSLGVGGGGVPVRCRCRCRWRCQGGTTELTVWEHAQPKPTNEQTEKQEGS